MTQAATLSKHPNNIGLMGYWPMNENTGSITYDFSGNKHTATLVNSPVWTQGKYAAGLNFDESYGTAGNVINPDVITVSAWAQPTSIVSTRVMVSKCSTPVGSDGCDYELLISGGKYTFSLWNTSSSTVLVSDTADADTTKYSFVVGTYDGSVAKIYVDGVLKATSASFSRNARSSKDLHLGDRPDTETIGYWGDLDDVRIYNSALSASDVLALYTPTVAKYKAVDKTGMVGYWPMDEGMDTKAGDFSGNGNTGTLTNGPTWITGKVGAALQFDGSDDYVAAGTASSLAFTKDSLFSMSAWIKTSQDAINTCIMGKWSSAVGYFMCSINGKFYMQVQSGPSDYIYRIGNTAEADGRWHHVVATYAGTSNPTGIKLYVDGVEDTYSDAATSGSLGSLSNASDFTIGARGNVGTVLARFNGQVDDVRVYNRVLSATEIGGIYNSGAHAGNMVQNVSQNNTLTSGLVGMWSFNGPDVSGTTAYDRSTNTNNGTLTNGPKIAIGKVGQGLQFDGSNDHVAIANDSQVSSGSAITISAWVKSNTSGVWQGLVGSQGSGTGYHYQITPSNYLQLNVYANSVIGDAVGSVDLSQYVNHWVFLTATYDGSSVKVYVNGVLDATGSASGSIISAADMRIGQTYDSNRMFSGSMDEVRIYNRALSASEVLQLYNLGK